MSGEILTIRMIRNADSVPWGFRLQGGSDFSIPLSIQKVIEGSIAEKVGLYAGDQVCKIAGKNADILSHKQAQDSIIAARNDLELIIQRGGARIWKPAQTVTYGNTNSQPFVKHSLQHDQSYQRDGQPETTQYHHNGGIVPPGSGNREISSGSISSKQQIFNNAPKPFGYGNIGGGGTINPSGPQGGGVGVKAVYHSQYNSPIGMYSPENVIDAFEGQTKGVVITTGLQNLNLNNRTEKSPINESAVYKYIHEQKPQVKPSAPIQSGSFKRLEGYVSDHSNSDGTSNYQQQMASGSTVSPSKLTECGECGRPIVGVFVKIGENRHLHPDCFKCSTCGTPLKNQGYYNINQRLYCDVHARAHQTPNNVMGGNGIPKNASNMCTSVGNHQSLPNNYNQPQNNNYSIPTAPAFTGNTYRNPGGLPNIGARNPMPQASENIYQQQSYQTANPNVKTNWRPPAPSVSNNIDQTNTYQQQQIRQLSPPKQTNYYPSQGSYGSNSTQIPIQVSSDGNYNTVTNQPGIIGAANAGIGGGTAEANKSMMRRGHGIFNETLVPGVKMPQCEQCHNFIRGPYISALNKAWCPNHFECSHPSCHAPLQTTGFVEEKGKIYCERCYEQYFAPRCTKCGRAILGDCLNALDKPWHPECFCCAKCHRPFGNSTFYMENGQPYCENDWNNIFTIKCDGCHRPIQANQRWVEALNKSFHSECFKCSVCNKPLEGQSFFAKDGLPFCKIHAVR